MTGINSFHELEVWRLAMNLAERIYRETQLLPKSEQYGLASQLRRAAASIPANVAEGFCRHSLRSYRYHVSVALGSQAEVLTYLDLCDRLSLLDGKELPSLREEATRVGKLLNGLWRALGRASSDTLKSPEA